MGTIKNKGRRDPEAEPIGCIMLRQRWQTSAALRGCDCKPERTRYNPHIVALDKGWKMTPTRRIDTWSSISPSWRRLRASNLLASTGLRKQRTEAENGVIYETFPTELAKWLSPSHLRLA